MGCTDSRARTQKNERVYYVHNNRPISIIFLDVDGVLNSSAVKWRGQKGVDAENLDNLRYLINRCNYSVRIVLSTARRRDPYSKKKVVDVLKWAIGRDLVIGSTPTFNICTKRAYDIDEYFMQNREWLRQRYTIKSWVVLDDLPLDKTNERCAQILHGHFVRVNEEYGLTRQNAEMAISILNNIGDNELNSNPKAYFTLYP